jgi:DNA-binding NarL/FixJ family response regulator
MATLRQRGQKMRAYSGIFLTSAYRGLATLPSLLLRRQRHKILRHTLRKQFLRLHRGLESGIAEEQIGASEKTIFHYHRNMRGKIDAKNRLQCSIYDDWL